MLIHRMTAVFGKLQEQTLELNDGLNIIQAPNETGKSTWCAFILAMLYGINSRERDRAGMPADKNRYAPWSGAAMSGRLDCRAENQDITLLRTTKRSAAPMGEFRAQYTDTADEVSWLNAALCGEQLLGVTRDVYARSAFIRQNNLEISQNSELERRIASLISSGEESTSYTEAADTLKKQLNQRRHNRTGQMPALEAELMQLQKQAEDAETLSAQILSLRQQEQTLIEQESVLQQELDRYALETENQEQLLAEAKAIADLALRRADTLRQQLEADRIPENETISRLRGAIVNLGTSRHTLEKARATRDDAMKEFLLAEASVARNPFAGQTVEHVNKFVNDTIASAHPSAKAMISLIILGVAAIVLGLTDALHLGQLSYLGIPIGLLAIIAPLCIHLNRKRNLSRVLKKHGLTTTEGLRTLAGEYANLLTVRDAAQENLNKHSEYTDTLYNSISSNEQAILLEIRRFAPSAYDLSTADSLLRGCAIRRKELTSAELAARDALAKQAAAQKSQVESATASQTAASKAHTESELARIADALRACRNAILQLTGQLSAIGDISQLHTEIKTIESQLESLQSEYSALQLALEALTAANQTMQNRFAPALGRRTAQLFNQLTHGQYQSVILDRNFHLSAEPAEDHIYRDVSLLSAGAADQLYLAARLAICETVLPPEKNAPLILDDALTNFDDERCASALRLLKELSRHRQILLFTCHSREAAFFAGDREVTIHQLTNSAKKV